MKKNFELLVENNNGNFVFYGYDFVTRQPKHKVAEYFEPIIQKKFKEDFEKSNLFGIKFVGRYIPSLKMFIVNTIKRTFEIWDDEDEMFRENPIYEMNLEMRIY